MGINSSVKETYDKNTSVKFVLNRVDIAKTS